MWLIGSIINILLLSIVRDNKFDEIRFSKTIGKNNLIILGLIVLLMAFALSWWVTIPIGLLVLNSYKK